MVAFKEKEQATPKKHVLTKKEAWRLLDGCNEYLKDATRLIGGREKNEIMAEGMLREGHNTLADLFLLMHSELKQFGMGNYRDGRSFNAGPSVNNLIEEAEHTRFARAVKDMLQPLSGFTEILGDLGERGIGVDWEKSSKVLAEVKAKEFPETLTMVEKLDRWQRDTASGKGR